MEDQALPKIHPLAKLYPAKSNKDGEPQWTLYHPVSNKYFKIGWMEFECISRLHKFNNVAKLLSNLKTQTHLNINEDDIQSIIMFLQNNGLIDGSSDMMADDKPQSFFKKAMHGYLYFTVPLFKPQVFLDKTFSFVRPLFSKFFVVLMMMLLAVSVMITIPKIDEFLNSFTQILTLEGIILTIIVYTVIKIIHELAHAYTATKYNVPVPHMGIAFIVMYPIFYTEATGAWRLTDKSARIHIGLAGVLAELYIAAIALMAWHFMDPGLGQMIAFSTVMVSLIGSLFINLNPLMRFDGYYVLSDATEIENLHSTAIDYARHWIRKNILGLNDDLPHDYTSKTARFLTWFGIAVLIYRFFLFLGIAVLVYHVFMKPLGLLFMAVELLWFIGFPVWRELKIWIERRHEIVKTTRFKFTLIGFIGLIVFLIIPFERTLTLPAVKHAIQYQAAYPATSSKIIAINIKNNDVVNERDSLVILKSDELERDLQLAEQNLQILKTQKRREKTSFDTYKESGYLIDEEIKAAEIRYNALKEKTLKLNIKADFDGKIMDLDNNLRVGQTVIADQALFRLVKPENNAVTAYVNAADLDRIQIGAKGWFRAHYDLFNQTQIIVKSIEVLDMQALDFPSLSASYHGEIPTQITNDGIIPLNSIYKVELDMVKQDQNSDLGYIIPGHIMIENEKTSLFVRFFKKITQIIRNELSFN